MRAKTIGQTSDGLKIQLLRRGPGEIFVGLRYELGVVGFVAQAELYGSPEKLGWRVAGPHQAADLFEVFSALDLWLAKNSLGTRELAALRRAAIERVKARRESLH